MVDNTCSLIVNHNNLHQRHQSFKNTIKIHSTLDQLNVKQLTAEEKEELPTLTQQERG